MRGAACRHVYAALRTREVIFPLQRRGDHIFNLDKSMNVLTLTVIEVGGARCAG